MTVHTDIHPTQYYRLPWTLNDNILGWLEPTKRCNLYCEGCYSRNDPNSDKTLEQVQTDLDAFVAQRTVDSISIAGGDPLLHPDIVEIVRLVKDRYDLKPVLNTNGMALTPKLLRDLKDAGLFGFTFHIDSSQTRKGWKGKNEIELNELRLHYARMVAEVGGLSVAFNSTVFPHTLKYVPDLEQWARDHIDIVHSMVFILFRTMRTREFDHFANGKPVELDQEVVYYDQDENPEPLVAADVVRTLRTRDAKFEPCAYLGGTKDPNSFKWLLSGRLGSPGKTYGYVGPKYMELVQQGNHILNGKYLAYSNPELLSAGRSMMAGFSAVDSGVRGAAAEYVKSLVGKAIWKAPTVHFQTIVIIQPIDMMKDGETNMCDGCPDMTVHNGELVWSCRLDERLTYGCFLTAAPKVAEEPKIIAPDALGNKKKTPKPGKKRKVPAEVQA
jgi:pyruvate-formate lyase-activating enzyme